MKRKRSSPAASPSPTGTHKKVASQCTVDSLVCLDGLAPEVATHLIQFLPLVDKLNLRCASSRWLALVHASCPVLRRAVNVAALRGLSRRFSRQESLFCCGGTTPLAQPLRLYLKREQQGSVAKGTCQVLSFPLVKGQQNKVQGEGKALKEGLAAAFGRGCEEVPRALQLPASCFAVNFHVADILDKIKRILSPHSWRIRAELHQLDIHSAGSHPASHVDASQENGTFGTLVVCLPTSFKGGELRVKRVPSQVLFPLSNDEGNESNNEMEEEEGQASRREVKWAALLSGCEHEILPLMEGHSVVLTYKLYTDNKNAKGTKQQEERQPDTTPDGEGYKTQCFDMEAVRKKLKDILADDACFHEGFDALVHDAAESVGLKTSLRCFSALQASGQATLLMWETYPSSVNWSEWGTNDFCSQLRFLLWNYPTPRLLVDATSSDGTDIPLGGLDDKMQEEVRQMWESIPKKVVQWCTDKPKESSDTLVAVTATQGYGLDSGIASFYVSALLLVEVPPRLGELRG
ncbi:hypothetical protein QOT17_014115 [Balamuthia mandrillaris]